MKYATDRENLERLGTRKRKLRVRVTAVLRDRAGNRASGRPQDQIDIEALETARRLSRGR
jgi:hypothetical protein